MGFLRSHTLVHRAKKMITNKREGRGWKRVSSILQD
jgi:hypothetical protein